VGKKIELLLIKTKEKKKNGKNFAKTKIVTAIFMILLMTSLILMVSPSSFQPIKTAKAQTVLPTGVVPTNNQFPRFNSVTYWRYS